MPRIFEEIRRLGDVDDEEMARVFNLGVGMVLVVAPDAVDRTLEALGSAGRRGVGRWARSPSGTGRVVLAR